MHRFRLGAGTACAASLTALGLVLAVPASAAPALTRSDVAGALLTPGEVGDGWERTGGGRLAHIGPGAGCEDGPGGVTPTAARFGIDRQFASLDSPHLVSEALHSYATRRAARRDVSASIRLLERCRSFTSDTLTLRIRRIPVPDVAGADRSARWRVTAAGDSAGGPFAMYVVLTRHGRHEVMTVVGAVGDASPADRTAMARESVRLARLATAKVADRLGR